MIDYLLLGHVTQDRLDEKRIVLGGTATYAALTARNLGRRVGVLTSTAFEPGLIDVLEGILVARMPAEETTRFVNRYVDGRREQTVEAVAEALGPELLLPDWRHPEIVHLAPIVGEVKPEAVGAFPRSLVGITPQGWMRAWEEEGRVRAVPWASAATVLARADATVLSEDDLADPGELPGLLELAKLLVLTRGPRGASVYVRGAAPEHVPAFVAARETDPTGAGDVFAAAFFVHLKSTGDPVESAAFANCVASFAVEKRAWSGIPTLEQVHDRWRRGKRHQQAGPAG